jgi:hypothetical protein
MWCLCARQTPLCRCKLTQIEHAQRIYPLSDPTKANLCRQSATKQARVKCEPDNLEKTLGGGGGAEVHYSDGARVACIRKFTLRLSTE